MKSKLIILALLFSSAFVQAQQTSYNANFYWLQLPLINPAASGVQESVDLALGSSFSTNNSYSSNPLFFRADFKIAAINSGLGISYFNNNYSDLLDESTSEPLSYSQTIRINYNYQFSLFTGTLSLGINGQYKRSSWNFPSFIPPDTPIDPELGEKSGYEEAWGIGFGTQFTKEKWHLGISYSPVFTNNTQLYNDYSNLHTFFATGAYKFSLLKNWQIEPGVNVSINSVATITSIYTQFIFYKWAFLGASLVQGGNQPDMVTPFAAIKIVNRLYVQYGYTMLISDLNSKFSNQHSLTLRYSIATKK